MKKKDLLALVTTTVLAGGLLIAAGGGTAGDGNNGNLFNGLGRAYIDLVSSYEHWQEGSISRRQWKRERSLAVSLLRQTLTPNRIIYSSEHCFFKKPGAEAGNVFSLSCLDAGRTDEASGLLFVFFDNSDRRIDPSKTTSPEILKKIGKGHRIAGALKIIAMTADEASSFGPDFYGTFVVTNKSLRIFCRVIEADL